LRRRSLRYREIYRSAGAAEEIAADMVGLDRHAALGVAQHQRRQRRGGQLAVTSAPSASSVAKAQRVRNKKQSIAP
jgi:hypothetical protein